MKWICSMSLATVATLGFASAVPAAGLFGSHGDKGCATTNGCNPPVACATQPQKKSGLFDCLFGKKSPSCGTTCAPQQPVCGPAAKPVCTTPVTCAPGCATQPKRGGLFDCCLFGKKQPAACGTTCAPRQPVCAPVTKPVCTTPVSCAPGCATQPKRGGLFDCCLFGKKQPAACGTTCAPQQPGCGPQGCGPQGCAPQPRKSGGLFDCFRSKQQTSCAATCATTCAPGHIQQPAQPPIQYKPADQPKPAGKPTPAAKPEAKPMPKAPPMPEAKPIPAAPAEDPANAYYPSRVRTQQSAQQNRLEELFGAPN